MKQANFPDIVAVHPTVLLSVVDHYNRVGKDLRRRVVGVLLGMKIIFQFKLRIENLYNEAYELFKFNRRV